MNLQDAAQQALEALESLQGGCTDSDDGTVEAITVWCPEVIDALHNALTENKRDWSLLEATQESLREHIAEIQTLRAALAKPPAQARQPLTEDQIKTLFKAWHFDYHATAVDLIRSVERACAEAWGVKLCSITPTGEGAA